MSATPPDSSATPASVHFTPHSAGAGSNTSYQTNHTQKEYKPYLEVDIQHTATIPFREFLSLILLPRNTDDDGDKDTDWDAIFKPFGEDNKFCELLRVYAKDPVKSETYRYHPFNTLVNYILENLGPSTSHSPDSIVICRNDPSLIWGSVSSRKPDCVVVHESAMSIGERDSVDNLSESGPPEECNFYWSELLAFVEFKLENTIADDVKSKAKKTKPKGKPSGGPSRQSKLRSNTRTSTADSSSSVHSASLNIPSNTVPNATPSPHGTQDGTSGSSLKRSGEDLEHTPSNKRLKDDEVKTRGDHLVQCASYALEMLSHGSLYTHVLGALVTDSQLELLYYDRSLPIRSEAVNFCKTPSYLVEFVYFMRHATLKNWGRVDKIERVLNWPPTNPFESAILKLDGGNLVLRLKDIIFVQHALIGRGTCVVLAELVHGDKEKYGGEIVVKFSFTPEGRTSEGDMLDHIIKRAKELNDDWVLNHLPSILYHETFKTDETDKTNIQYQLAEYFKSTQIDGKWIEYERRNLQVLVMKKLLPIEDMKTADTLIPVINGIFKCYKWLHEKARVIHRDISENNLMYWKDANKDVTYGVLSDYDLSLLLDQQDLGPRSKQRTGTRPFMSRDLLEPTPCKHLYRHDLESLFYVIIVLMFRSQGEGPKVKRFEKFHALESWFILGPAELLEKKEAWFARQIPHPAPEFERLYPLAIKMRGMFNEGYQARLRYADKINLGDSDTLPTFAEPTLGGLVDFDKFQAILDSV